jgi:hypothetical protein
MDTSNVFVAAITWLIPSLTKQQVAEFLSRIEQVGPGVKILKAALNVIGIDAWRIKHGGAATGTN